MIVPPVFSAALRPGQEDMEFKVELTDTYHAISVNMTVRSPDGDRARAQEYFDKVQALTKEFFFSYPEKFIPVYLEDHGMNKINCIKTIREFLQIGLKEAKDLAEAPKPVCLSDGMPRGQSSSGYLPCPPSHLRSPSQSIRTRHGTSTTWTIDRVFPSGAFGP